MSDKARYVVERFPDLADAIKQYSSDNRFFRGLCEDYGEAVEACVNAKRRTILKIPNVLKPAARSSWISEREILLELHRWIDG